MNKNRPILYEVECERHTDSPREFYSYCNRRLKAKAGMSIEDWVDYNYWADQNHHYYNKTEHSDWDDPEIEVIKEYPYEVQLFLSNNYNFILEWDNGHGYMYVKEYER